MWNALGWLGNACFFGRFLVQWRAAERAGRVVTPNAFWWLSLLGSVCLLFYMGARGETVLLAGVAINAGIYARNLHWTRGGERVRPLGPRVTLIVAITSLLALIAGAFLQEFARGERSGASGSWLTVLVVGQSLWSSRFLIQWIDLERRRASRLPPAFWWVSLAGNISLLAYALHRGDAVLIAGYALGPIIQVRNLVLGGRERRGRAATS